MHVNPAQKGGKCKKREQVERAIKTVSICKSRKKVTYLSFIQLGQRREKKGQPKRKPPKSKKPVDTTARHSPPNPNGSNPAPPSHGECPTAEFLPSSIAFIA
jgi:hypothetical protein